VWLIQQEGAARGDDEVEHGRTSESAVSAVLMTMRGCVNDIAKKSSFDVG